MPEETTSITEQILYALEARGGAIPFSAFMELALYHPELGYYRRGGPTRIGAEGDFITNVAVSPLFGRILAGQLDTYRRQLEDPPDYSVVEYGAHRGQLRDDICAASSIPAYHTIEVGEAAPEAYTGCVLAHEFLDALPVHRVRVVDGEWRELYVVANPPAADQDPNACPFQERLGPLSDPRLGEALADLPAHLMEGYTTEVNLRALDWLADISRRLIRGKILIIDYGYERHDYFAPHRQAGTLTCYHRHQRSADPFAHLGEQDITAHLEFTSLIACAEALGLRRELFLDQGRFLLGAGAALLEAIVTRDAGQLSSDRAALQQLIHPDFMGRAFKVLVLSRDTAGHCNAAPLPL